MKALQTLPLELRRSLGRAGHTDWTHMGVEMRAETREANWIKLSERRRLKIQPSVGRWGRRAMLAKRGGWKGRETEKNRGGSPKSEGSNTLLGCQGAKAKGSVGLDLGSPPSGFWKAS